MIVLTSFADDDQVIPAVRAGAAGYLLKDVEPAELGDAIRMVHRRRGAARTRGHRARDARGRPATAATPAPDPA